MSGQTKGPVERLRTQALECGPCTNDCGDCDGCDIYALACTLTPEAARLADGAPALADLLARILRGHERTLAASAPESLGGPSDADRENAQGWGVEIRVALLAAGREV
jgi:hypothetical protein